MSDSGFPARAELGPNAGLVDEMYRLFVENPNAVSAGWRDFFADAKGTGLGLLLGLIGLRHWVWWLEQWLRRS